MNPAFICFGTRTPIGRYGGAIAVGQAFGAPGARRALTRVRPLHAGDRFGVAAMSIGVGQGIALPVERV